MRSIAQLTGVALTLVHSQMDNPWRCLVTSVMIGNWTYGGLGTVINSSPSLVTTLMGS